MPRWAAKTDKTQGEIVRALVKAGCTVKDASRVGQGFPDLVVGRAGATYLLEVKTKTGKLTEHQVSFFDSWKGHCCVVRSVDDALRAVGLV